MNNVSFTNGLPELLILRLLSSGEKYGYQLVSEIAKSSDERIHFSEGCIYPVLHRLESKGLLATREEEVAGRTRRYYRLGSKGQKRLTVLLAELRAVNQAVETIGGVNYAL
jgi:PadR family transcriptional regulator PadR